MVDLTMSNSITQAAPLAFAYYGENLALMGKISEGCRLGKLVPSDELCNNHIHCKSFIDTAFVCFKSIITQGGWPSSWLKKRHR